VSIDRAITSRRLAPCLALACGLLWAQHAGARSPDGRLDPQQREQLRHDLRGQGSEGGGRSPEERYRGAEPPGGGWSSPGLGGRPDRPGGEQRERMTPQERQELRLLLRERRRSGRE
jgi:hypothetical protein